ANGRRVRYSVGDHTAANGGRADQKFVLFISSRRRHPRLVSDWSSDVCSSDLSSPFTPVTFRKHHIISGKVDDVHRASVVPFERMLEVGDPVPPRGNTDIAHVATDLAEHMTDGIFEPVLA